ncbi:unnamed protein product [Litomosoides sigmodontis]|uniref:Uncharacterized protein n=1 Tax=Litomosoides sigmodontis TaxID=42156 RepID=A0A3P6S5I4_LITSI|nr:unnamed protein product [Litomosoides sigmodontis]
MSTTTARGIASEEPLVYADLSQQFVPFEESDESTTPPVTIEESRPDEHSENITDELVNRSPNSDCDRNVVGYAAPEMLREVRVMGDQSIPAAPTTRQFRKRSSRRRGGNGLCPPHPPEDVPVVDWSEPTEIKHIFPKTYNYVVYAQARYSSQYLNLSKWRKEFDFFFDKYKYWRDIIQKKQLTDYKEITKAKQLVGQLRWLLDHCWEGDESKPLVPEMLWRARKEEARRCEQLLIRKEYYKRKVMVKKAIPPLSGRLNNKIILKRFNDDHCRSVKDNTDKLPPMFQRESIDQAEIGGNLAGLCKSQLSNKLCKEKEDQDDSPNFWKERDRVIKKRAHLFSLQFLVRRWAEVLKQMQTPLGIMRPLCYRAFVRNRVEQYVQELVAAYEKIKDSDDFDEQIIHILLRRDILLKEDMCENGLESLTCKWVIFESKSPKVFKKKADRDSCESSKSTSKFPLSNTSSTLLKVRDYLDDDVKSAASVTSNSGAGQMMRDSPEEVTSEATNGAQLAATRGESVRGRSRLTNDDAEIPRPVAIKPSSLAEHEKNRLELQEVVAVETLWAAFAKTETPKFKDDKPILDAIDAVLSACKSYRSILEVPLPKTLADLRRAARFRSIHESVAVLQALIIQRHEAKTGRRLDLTLFETPEIRRLQAQFTASLAAHNSSRAVPVGFEEFTSQISSSTRVESSVSSSISVKSLESSSGIKPLKNDVKQEECELPPKKKQRQLNERAAESNKDELQREKKTMKNGSNIEMLATNRPKRHIKAPQRFIFDDEEKEEEKKKKTVTRERTKTTKGNSPKAMEKLKETSQYSSVDKEKQEKNIDSSSFSMELSNMETIVVIPEDDSTDASDFNSWSLNTDDNILLDYDLINVTAEHKLKYESDGIVHDVFRYVGTRKNGTTHEVSRRVYELWTNRKIAEISGQSTAEESESKGTENTTEQQQSIFSGVAQQKQTSISLLTSPDVNSKSNKRVTNHNNVSNIYSNAFVNRLSSTGPCSSQDIAFGITSKERNENGDCGPWRQVSEELYFRVAYRKEASINGPLKMDKLKTQYDHLLMISEKNYVRKLFSEWMYVPEGGLFDDRVKRIRQFIHELEDVLNQPDSAWRDYFNMKKYLQTLIDNVMAEFSALSGQVASTHFLHASDFAFSSSRSTVSDAERDGTDVSIRPKSN